MAPISIICKGCLMRSEIKLQQEYFICCHVLGTVLVWNNEL